MRLVCDTAARMLHVGDRMIPCAIGRAGALPAAEKSEGDGATPLGRWPIRGVLLRPDRVAAPPLPAIAWRWLRPSDGWCDAAGDPAYNSPIRHPYPTSAERLWREDGLYDAIVVLGHNDGPPRAGAGSAIFLHCWNDAAPTEGCVAIARAPLLALLPAFSAEDAMTIV